MNTYPLKIPSSIFSTQSHFKHKINKTYGAKLSKLLYEEFFPANKLARRKMNDNKMYIISG